MSWIISRALMEDYASSLSSLGQVEESLAENCSDGELSAQLSLIPTQHKFWHNGKTMDASNLSQFGLTCRILTEDLGEELLTWFLADSRAKTLAQPERAQESMVNAAAYGSTWREWFARYDPNGSSWKTRQCSLLGDSDQFSETWPRWGLMLDGELLEQTPLVQTTKESASGLWLTPKATDTGRGEKSETFVKRMGDRGAHCFQSLPAQVGGKLNPEWLEWLMGWPTGWTEYAALAMDKSRFAQLWRFDSWQEIFKHD